VANPGYAIPFRFLAEAQEKKGLKKQAIKSYQRYLDLYRRRKTATKSKRKSTKLHRGKWTSQIEDQIDEVDGKMRIIVPDSVAPLFLWTHPR